MATKVEREQAEERLRKYLTPDCQVFIVVHKYSYDKNGNPSVRASFYVPITRDDGFVVMVDITHNIAIYCGYRMNRVRGCYIDNDGRETLGFLAHRLHGSGTSFYVLEL